MDSSQRLPIVGGGIAAIPTAWLLRIHPDVRLFGLNGCSGSHTHAILVEEEARLPVRYDFL
jgi:predicted NAD/FAD-binding protein